MKIIKMAILLVFSATVNYGIMGQAVVTEWNEEVNLDGKTTKKEVKIDVKESSSTITVQAIGTIEGGLVCIQLCNPKGKCQATLSLCASPDNKAKGSLEEKLEATPGEWTLCIDNKGSEGSVTIKVTQQ